jgi:ABC-type multidrug transport system ATPase subunit
MSAAAPGARAVTRAETPAVELRCVSKRYRDLVALQPLDLTIADGEFFCLLGPSGCGKTTAASSRRAAGRS